MLVLTRSAGNAIIIGDQIVVKVLQVKGDKVRLGIQAPKELTVGAAHSQIFPRYPDRDERNETPLECSK